MKNLSTRLAAGVAVLGMSLSGCGNSQAEPEEVRPVSEPSSAPEVPSEPVPIEESPPPGEPGGPAGEPLDPSEPASGGPTAEATTEAVSDEEVEQFAKAQIELLELQQRLAQRAQGGEDQTMLQAELREKVPEVVAESGLSLERFEQIAEKVAVDDGLRRQVEEAIGTQL